jgi:hypothetical protein
MEATQATLFAVIIEAMITSTIAAALSGKIKDEEYTRKMQDKKAQLAEILETL